VGASLHAARRRYPAMRECRRAASGHSVAPFFDPYSRWRGRSSPPSIAAVNSAAGHLSVRANALNRHLRDGGKAQNITALTLATMLVAQIGHDNLVVAVIAPVRFRFGVPASASPSSSTCGR
jgi:hypothetical protein